VHAGGVPVNESRIKPHDLAMLCLRVGLGIFFLRAGWIKVTHVSAVVGLLQRLHLPLPHVSGPVQAIVEFAGGLLLLPGLLTRLVGVLLAIDMAGALLLVKLHTTTFIGQEWLAMWISLAFVTGGAGAVSLDALLRNRRAQARTGPRSAAYQQR
jgi:putative oxidoreductase